MRTGLSVNGDHVTTRLGEGFKIGIGRGNHQMAIKHRIAVLAQRLNDSRAIGNIRHEMAVHHIEMNPFRPGFGHIAHFFAKAGEIGGEDGRGNADRSCGHGLNPVWQSGGWRGRAPY